MGTAWIGFVGALVGGIVVAVSSFLNARYSFRWNTGWERRTVVLSKLEELFTTIGEFREACVDTYTYLVTRRPGQAIEPPEAAPLTRVRVLVRFYAPELRNLLARLEAAQESFGALLLDLVVHQEEKDARAWADGIGRLGEVVGGIDDLCDRMEEVVVRRSQKSAFHAA